MKKLVLAEKPSVGKELGRVLGCVNRGKYLEGDSYVVTWALGHLVTLCSPDWYGEEFRHWRLSNLPILPEKLETQVIDKSREQYEVVKFLLDRDDISSIIIATDAGREGELVARWILKQAGCTKPAERLWISSQTDMAIKDGFAHLRPAADYDKLYAAAESRSYADWYIGYNVSRAMSCWFDTRLSAGRVQTPTLALMTSREDEIEKFTGRFYWTLKADFGKFTASWHAKDGSVRIEKEEAANELESRLTGATGKVVKVAKVPKTERPPLAYDLTELQRDANCILGFSAKETLDTLQRLYEVHKIVTYPRTDSRYITADIVPTIPSRLAALGATPFAARCSAMLSKGIRNDLSRLVNDELVSDHHALLPTEQRVDLSKLSDSERRLWELVVTRFLETLSADYEYTTTTLEAEVCGESFVSRLTVPTSQGFRDVARDVGRRSAVANPDDDDCESGLASLFEGSELTVSKVILKRNATLPPSRYTEADLLYAMEHAGRLVEDADLRKNLENGLGTPATRADIIEKLIQNNCIERSGMELVPTAKGRELVRLVPAQLKSAELTGRWEKRLAAIASGEEMEKPFIEDIKRNAADLVNQVKSSREHFDPALMGDAQKPCPSCGWPMVNVEDEFGRMHHVCQRFSCGYEEMELRHRVEVPQPVQPQTTTAAPVKKVVASTKTLPDGRKVVVVKKSAVPKAAPAPVFKYETTIEVVKPSHYRKPGSYQNSSPRPQSDRPREPRREDFRKFEPKHESEGGTFADFIKAAEDRKRKDEERRKARR